jgi:hypothetical protein
MKTVLSITAKIFACLFIAGLLGFGGCASMNSDENGDNYTGGAVPYAPCPCGEEGDHQNHITKGEALLFVNSVPKQIDSDYFGEGREYRNYIVYYSEGDSAELYEFHDRYKVICSICNFPSFAKKWNIPDSGVTVDYEGKYYDACYPIYGFANFSHYSMILTELKLKQNE